MNNDLKLQAYKNKSKSKLVAYILLILLGTLGVHRFYLRKYATLDKEFEQKLITGLDKEARDSCLKVSKYLSEKSALVAKNSKKSTFKFIIGKWYYFVFNFIVILLLSIVLQINIKWYKANAYIFSDKLDTTLFELIVGESSLILILSIVLQFSSLTLYKNWLNRVSYRLNNLSSYLDDTLNNAEKSQ